MSIFVEKLQLIYQEQSKDKTKLLLPVVLEEGAEIPSVLTGIPGAGCNRDSDPEANMLRQRIQNEIARKEYSHKPKSNRKRKNRTGIYLALCITLILVINILLVFIPSVIWEVPPFSNEKTKTTAGIICLSVFELFMFFIFLFCLFLYFQKKKEAEREAYSNRLKKDLSLENEKISSQQGFAGKGLNSDYSALGVMKVNLEDIKEFYTWSQQQAKSAFWLAVIMCIVGFGLICFAVVAHIVQKIETSTTIISAIGGVVTELISATSLFVYQKSISQLNHYHEALHEDERFLSMVNLVSTLSSDEVRDNMLSEIIKCEMQLNLAEKQGGEKTNTDTSSKKNDSDKKEEGKN